MLSAIVFIVLLLLAVSLFVVALIWDPGDRFTPEKTRLIRGGSAAAALALVIASGVVMLSDMKPGKPSASDAEPVDQAEDTSP